MWLALLGYIVFVLAVAGIGNLAGDVYATILSVLGSFVLGFEGNAIRRLTLARRGWREVGEAFGRNLEEAEIRFFYDWASLPEARRYDGAAGGSSGGAVAASDEPILGLFPEAEGARL